MDPELPPLREGLLRLREKGLLPEEEHPDFADLLAARSGGLPVARADGVSRHLASCPICQALLADAADFPRLEPPAGMAPPGEGQIEAGRRRLLAAMERADREEAGEAPAPAVLRAVPPLAVVLPPQRRPLPARPWLLAATVVLALGLAVFWPGRRVETHLPVPAPQAQRMDFDLRASGPRSPGAVATAVATRQIFLRLARFPPGFEAYGARVIRRESGKVALAVDLYASDGRLVGAIEPGQLPPGLYEMSAWGRRAGAETPFDRAWILRIE